MDTAPVVLRDSSVLTIHVGPVDLGGIISKKISVKVHW